MLFKHVAIGHADHAITFVRNSLKNGLRALGLGAILVLITGCTTTVVSSGTTANFSKPSSTMNVVFVDTELAKKGGGTNNKANQERLDLGVHILEALPSTLAKRGIPSVGKNLTPENIPVDAKGFTNLFAPMTAPILFISPSSAFTACTNACFVFRIQARLVAPDSGKVIWTSTVDLPPKPSRFHDFSGVAADFSIALVAQLIKDGVIKETEPLKSN